ncbi:MAG: hypothetical protein ABI763_02975 [Bacteroidota bacterium]
MTVLEDEKNELEKFEIWQLSREVINIPEICSMNPEEKSWIKRIGIVGFMFFFIKGLLWLAAFYFGFRFFE